MPDITFILADGSEVGFEAPAGASLMQAATGMGVAGIVGECGGQARCATCHVYVDAAWAARLPRPRPDEEALLALTAAPRQPTSRLACQIRLTDEMQGLVVRVPDRQY
jgi:2Fe-2S ferredoxin